MNHDLAYENLLRVTRRKLFGSTASGLGVAALATLMGKDSFVADALGGSSAAGAIDLPLPGPTVSTHRCSR